MTGFTDTPGKKTTLENDCREHYGEPIHIIRNGNITYGILEEIYNDPLVGLTAKIKPSIILGLDNKYKIYHKRATPVPLPFDVIRPLEGTLEQWRDKLQQDLENRQR